MTKKRRKNPKRQMPPALKRYWAARNRRLKNPGRRHSKTWDRCVKAVRKSGTAANPYAVCTSSVRRGNPRRKHRRNPGGQRVLMAQRPGGKMLKYVGGIKFAERGHAVRFPDARSALSLGRSLKSQFPVLKRYRLWAAR